MQPKSSALLILFSTVVWLAMPGCTPPAPVETDAPRLLAGKTVRVACPAGPAAAAVRAYSRPWASREGAKVEVITFEHSAGLESAGAADLWVMSPATLPRRAGADLLRPLPDTFTGHGDFNWPDLLPLYRERLLSWSYNRRIEPLAVPLMGESPIFIYRSDLLADAKRGEAFQKKYNRKLAPPTTWEEFADIAEFFHDTAAGGPAPSLPALPATDAGLDREFFTIAACYARRAMAPDEPARDDTVHQLFSFQYDHDTGVPRLNTKGFEYALKLMKRLQKCRPAGTSPSPLDAFRDKNAVLGLADVRLVAELQKSRDTRDKIGICRMPGGARWFEYFKGNEVLTPAGNRVPYLGSDGWLAAVPLGAAEPDAAFSLLADLAGRERSGQIATDPLWGGGPTRREQLEHMRWDAFGLDAEQTKALKDALRQTLQHPAVQNPAIRLRTVAEAAHEEILLKEIRTFLVDDQRTEAMASKVLETAAGRWQQLDKEREGNAALDDYRLSVGLLPKPKR
jgi:multiple sugar transport system substrate-binding protein